MKQSAILAISLLFFGCTHPISKPSKDNNHSLSQEVKPTSIKAAPKAELQMPLHPDKQTKFPAKIPGYPGADGSEEFPVKGYPEFVNYPGSIEHYRIQDQKYIPPVCPYNERSLVKNFILVEQKNTPKSMIERFQEPILYVHPLFQKPGFTRTKDKQKAVSIARLKPGGHKVKLHIGQLPFGLYIIRVIAAIETQHVRDGDPKDLILDIQVNDGKKGKANNYILRQKGIDNFYSMGEVFFYASDTRSFDISVSLHPDSKIDLLVHNIDIHYAYQECARKSVKKSSVLAPYTTISKNWKSKEAKKFQQEHRNIVSKRLKALTSAHPSKTEAQLKQLWRQQKDDILWTSIPPLNSEFISKTNSNSKFHSELPESIEQELKRKNLLPDNCSYAHGWAGSKWDPNSGWRLDVSLPNERYERRWGKLPYDWQRPWRMIHRKQDGTNCYYTLDDLKTNKPLPLLSFKVYSWGKAFPQKNKTVYFCPITQAVNSALQSNLNYLQEPVEGANWWPLRVYYLNAGIDEIARNYAMLLAKAAYVLPSYVTPHALNLAVTGSADTVHRCDYSHLHRSYRAYQYIDWFKLAMTYDYLFDYLKDNQEFAQALNRYIPWVKTPEDVQTFFETNILQYGAKQVMYFNHYYGFGHPELLAKFAALIGDKASSKPLLDMLFSRTWVYPGRHTSILDTLYQQVQRDGTNSVGSYFYTKTNSIAASLARWLDAYHKATGDTTYLINPREYQRLTSFPTFLLESAVAGTQSIHVGDVGGETAGAGSGFQGNNLNLKKGWKTNKDPRFAYFIYNQLGRSNETDEEWQELAKSAKLVTRNPYFTNKSRVLSDWGVILEAGTDSDDLKQRTAARIRVGRGRGHEHKDSLDLGIWAFGMPLGWDHGQRPGYASPSVKESKIHNTVTVDDKNWQGHSWCAALADMKTVQYSRVDSAYQKRFERQIALIDRSQTSTKHPKSYIVDVFRVSGGKHHTYNLHGPPNRHVKTNIRKSPLSVSEKKFLSDYKITGEQWGATIDTPTLTAEWKNTQTPLTFTYPKRGQRKTRLMRDPEGKDSPSKYLKVHLPGRQNDRLLSGLWAAAPNRSKRGDGSLCRQLHIRHDSSDSIFTAIWEPYAKVPFIKSITELSSPKSSSDISAVEIKLVNGESNICLAAMDSKKQHKFPEKKLSISSEFAFIARTKDQALKQINLVGAKEFKAKEFKLEFPQAYWQGKICKINYPEQLLRLDCTLPDQVLNGATFEVGMTAPKPYLERWTSYRAKTIKPLAPGTQVKWEKDACIYIGHIKNIETLDNSEKYQLSLSGSVNPQTIQGENKQLVICINGHLAGRCDLEWNKINIYQSKLDPKRIKLGDQIKIYNFGVGETWRTVCYFSLNSVGNYYQIKTTSDFKLTPNETTSYLWSYDAENWQKIGSSWEVNKKMLRDGTFYLKQE